MFAWQFQKALHVAEKHGWTRFVSMQDHLNLIYREEEREMLPLCREETVGVIPYSPLASGRLTRDWSKDRTLRSETDQIAKSKYDATAETDRQVVKRVGEIAEKHGVPRVHIALAWLLQKKPVTAPIIGATKITHLEDAVGTLSVNVPGDVVFPRLLVLPQTTISQRTNGRAGRNAIPIVGIDVPLRHASRLCDRRRRPHLWVGFCMGFLVSIRQEIPPR
jgi:aryl-alcohol dehydrogenase-like predicted oxidoreductase